jgi:hypothetical protein
LLQGIGDVQRAGSLNLPAIDDIDAGRHLVRFDG